MLSRVHRRSLRIVVLLLAALAAAAPLAAQERPANAPPAPTADDYARAEKFLAPAISALVVGGSVSPTWLPDDRFTYRSTTADGAQFLLVDPVKATKAPAFDHVKLAAALGAAAGGTFDPKKLPFQTIDLSADGTSVAFDVGARRWSCDVAGAACKDAGSARGGRGGEEGGRGAGRGGGAAGNAVTSPDGKRAVFIKDWNLWVRDVATGQEKALTTDGKDISATPPTTPAGGAAAAPSSCGRPIRGKSPPSSRTSARSATCTSWRRKAGTRCCSSGSTRCRATSTWPCSTA